MSERGESLNHQAHDARLNADKSSLPFTLHFMNIPSPIYSENISCNISNTAFCVFLSSFPTFLTNFILSTVLI